jgi:hypothetical protein
MEARLFRCLMVAIRSRSRSEEYLYERKREWKLPYVRRTECGRTGFLLQMGGGMRSEWRLSGQHAIIKDSIKALFTTNNRDCVLTHEANIAA